LRIPARVTNPIPAEGAAIALEERAGHEYVPPHDIAMIYSALGETDEAFRRLKAAYRERFSLLVFFELDPSSTTFAPIRASQTY
jgi:hypothetical protein